MDRLVTLGDVADTRSVLARAAERLHAGGHDSFAGAGAEILVDRARLAAG